MMRSSLTALANKRNRRTRNHRAKFDKQYRRRPLLEQLEDRRMLAAVSWDGGGGDLLWSNPLNWSNDQLPGPSDDVTIDASGDATILLESITSEVQSLELHDHLHVRIGGVITTGDITVSKNKAVWVEGTGAELRANDDAQIDGADLYATAGGVLEFLTDGDVSNTGGDAVWQAVGVGSVLGFPSLTTVSNGTAQTQDFHIEALQGGVVDLSSVTEIIDPSSGDERGRSTRLKSQGAGSVLKLGSLQNFVDFHANTTSEDNGDNDNAQYSRLVVNQGGTAELGALENVRGVYIPLDGSGTIDTSTITNLTYSRVEVSNASVDLKAIRNAYSTDFVFRDVDVDLPELRTLARSTFDVHGVTVGLPLANDINGASLYVADGAKLALPSVTTFANNNGDSVWRATGVGTAVSLPNLAAIQNGTAQTQDFHIEALQGAVIDLSAVTEIIDPIAGDQRGRSTRLKSEGAGSVLKLGSLQNFVDFHANTTSEDSGG